MGGGPLISGDRFLVIGRAGMDLYPDPTGTKTEDAQRFVSALGGSSANIAAALTRLDAKAALVTCVSDDAVGRFARNALQNYGIDARYVRDVQGEYRNSLALAESRTDDFQSVIYRNLAADFQMSIEDVEAVDYGSFDALVTTGTVLAAEPSRGAAFRAFELARQHGLTLVFDIDYRPYSWTSAEEAAEIMSRSCSACDFIIGNDLEFDFVAGAKGAGLSKAKSLAKDDGKTVVYKRGEKGSLTLTADTEIDMGVFEVSPLKPVGAGDAFMGGFLASIAAGCDLAESVRRGSASAAIVVTRVGCAPAMPTAKELTDFLASNACTTD